MASLSPAVATICGAALCYTRRGSSLSSCRSACLLFESDAKSRRRMLPFVVIGGATALYMLWALTAYPLQVYIRGNSIVYLNQGTNKTPIAFFYVIATCGLAVFLEGPGHDRLRRGKPDDSLLAVMEFKRYAFTSLWCAYAANRKSHHPRLLLADERSPAIPLCMNPSPREPRTCSAKLRDLLLEQHKLLLEPRTHGILKKSTSPSPVLALC